MRKFIIGFIMGSLLFGIAGAAFAEDGLQKIEAYLRPDLPITLNGQKVTLNDSPVMVDGNTFIRLRNLQQVDPNLQVNWDEQTQTVELSLANSSTVSGSTYGTLSTTNTVNNELSGDRKLTDEVDVNKITQDAKEINNVVLFGASEKTTDGKPVKLVSVDGSQYITINAFGEINKYFSTVAKTNETYFEFNLPNKPTVKISYYGYSKGYSKGIDSFMRGEVYVNLSVLGVNATVDNDTVTIS